MQNDIPYIVSELVASALGGQFIDFGIITFRLSKLFFKALLLPTCNDNFSKDYFLPDCEPPMNRLWRTPNSRHEDPLTLVVSVTNISENQLGGPVVHLSFIQGKSVVEHQLSNLHIESQQFLRKSQLPTNLLPA